ncbi:hypothetical protein PR202_ga22416 [Eleusine coracana subsp. coracana]|uniref:Uncharacterized protein n=1 Tax=Eleusine coracana subsp. coracana TaxID=191504 RepID=A0AAV5D333_ELECO|nr:hypothetical protein PR202_ga22416 [Eleusine coracana subsp. coracana]
MDQGWVASSAGSRRRRPVVGCGRKSRAWEEAWEEIQRSELPMVLWTGEKSFGSDSPYPPKPISGRKHGL